MHFTFYDFWNRKLLIKQIIRKKNCARLNLQHILCHLALVYYITKKNSTYSLSTPQKHTLHCIHSDITFNWAMTIQLNDTHVQFKFMWLLFIDRTQRFFWMRSRKEFHCYFLWKSEFLLLMLFILEACDMRNFNGKTYRLIFQSQFKLPLSLLCVCWWMMI